MPAGRPLRLRGHVTLTGPDGEQVRKVVQDAICDEMAATGLSPMQAGAAVGIPRDTVSMWLNEGRRLAVTAERCSPGWQPLAVRDQAYLAFYRAQQSAHARFIRDRLAAHRTIAQGNLITGRVTETIDPTRTEVDPATGQARPAVVAQKTERSRTLPDARAIEWELERLAREDFVDEDGQLRSRRIFAARVEVTGADGGPVRAGEEAEERAHSLLAELDAYEAGLTDRAEADRDLSGTEG